MKELKQFINESFWASTNGGFDNDHVKSLVKLTKWSESKIKELLNDFDEEFGGTGLEYDFDGKKLIFKMPDENRMWECDGKNWKEIK